MAEEQQFGLGGGVSPEIAKQYLDVDFLQSHLDDIRDRYKILDGMEGAELLEGHPVDPSKLPEIDLLSQNNVSNWHLRHQGNSRGTCTAFATCAGMELQLFSLNRYQQLSPEFLYYMMRHEQGYQAPNLEYWNKGATNLAQARKVIKDLGTCIETQKPYIRDLKLGLETDAPPAIRKAAKSFRAETSIYFNRNDGDQKDKFERIYSELKRNIPVIIGMPVYEFEHSQHGRHNWNDNNVWPKGIVWGPGEGLWEGQKPRRVSAHVVCLVGYKPDVNAPSGGWFIFKNSWGQLFARDYEDNELARDLLPRTGYGAISVHHISLCWEYLSLKFLR